MELESGKKMIQAFMGGKEFVEEMEKGLGEGPLTLQIFCCDCGTTYELNNVSIAMAFMTKATLLAYIRFVQNSKCRACEKKKGETDEEIR